MKLLNEKNKVLIFLALVIGGIIILFSSPYFRSKSISEMFFTGIKTGFQPGSMKGDEDGSSFIRTFEDDGYRTEEIPYIYILPAEILEHTVQKCRILGQFK